MCPNLLLVRGMLGLADGASLIRPTRWLAGFGDISRSFSFRGAYVSADVAPDLSIVGKPDYVHELRLGRRAKKAVGGED